MRSTTLIIALGKAGHAELSSVFWLCSKKANNVLVGTVMYDEGRQCAQRHHLIISCIYENSPKPADLQATLLSFAYRENDAC